MESTSKTVTEGWSRRLLVVRHSERCDYHFKKKGIQWLERAFDSEGHFQRFNEQLPSKLAPRPGGPRDYSDDTPITNSGYAYCIRTGELLRERGISIDFIYSSPAYRCMQTAQGILEGLQAKELRIRIEPGLFQWMRWCKHGLPTFLNPSEYEEAGFPVDSSYEGFDDAKEFDEKETLLDYYTRSFAIVRRILKLHPKGTILLVGHAGSLETLTRQLAGKKPRDRDQFRAYIHKTSYLAMNEIIELGDQWKITGSPIPALIHSGLDRC